MGSQLTSYTALDSESLSLSQSATEKVPMNDIASADRPSLIAATPATNSQNPEDPLGVSYITVVLLIVISGVLSLFRKIFG
ncbi:MAG: hypothetical protein WCY67_07915 [Acidithiobacillus sp.]